MSSSSLKTTFIANQPARVRAFFTGEAQISVEKISEQIVEKSPVAFEFRKAEKGDSFLLVASEQIHEALSFLRDSKDFEFNFLQVVSATDFPKKQRIELLYVLQSFLHGVQLSVKTEVSREKSVIKSVSDLFRAANWYERECFDLLGVEFVGHPYLERILLPEDWVGHPLRKDYQFPETYNGMKVPL